MDVVFLIDASSSISDSDYQKEIDFVKSILDYYYLHPQLIRIGCQA